MSENITLLLGMNEAGGQTIISLPHWYLLAPLIIACLVGLSTLVLYILRNTEAVRRLTHSADDKPVLVSTILQRDAKSRIVGEFVNEYMNSSCALTIVSKDDDGLHVFSPEGQDEFRTLGMLKAAGDLLEKDCNAT